MWHEEQSCYERTTNDDIVILGSLNTCSNIVSRARRGKCYIRISRRLKSLSIITPTSPCDTQRVERKTPKHTHLTQTGVGEKKGYSDGVIDGVETKYAQVWRCIPCFAET